LSEREGTGLVEVSGDTGGGGGAAGAGQPGRVPRAGAALRVLAGVAVAGVAVQAAVVECFLVPLHVGRWPVPVSVPAAVVGNVLLARLMARLTGRRNTAVLPPVLWLGVVLVLAAPRAEGDLVVPGSPTGLAFLFFGAIAGALGAASALMPGGRWRL
jgi:hypothetical protein